MNELMIFEGNNVDCDDCIFGKDDIFTLEEIKKRLIKEDWLYVQL